MLRRWGPSSPHYVYNTVPPRTNRRWYGVSRYETVDAWAAAPRPAMLPSVYATTRELGNSLRVPMEFWPGDPVRDAEVYCDRIPRLDFRDLHSILIKRRLFPIGLITVRKSRVPFRIFEITPIIDENNIDCAIAMKCWDIRLLFIELIIDIELFIVQARKLQEYTRIHLRDSCLYADTNATHVSSLLYSTFADHGAARVLFSSIFCLFFCPDSLIIKFTILANYAIPNIHCWHAATIDYIIDF